MKIILKSICNGNMHTDNSVFSGVKFGVEISGNSLINDLPWTRPIPVVPAIPTQVTIPLCWSNFSRH